MNKNEFLTELRKHLTVLDNGEQNDILEEYAQHIGMKIRTGLSEEEAIRDFGNIKELAAQILEAYHVDPEYRKKRQEQVAEEGKKIWKRFTEALRKGARGVHVFCKACCARIKAVWLKLKPFKSPSQKTAVKAADTPARSKEPNMNKSEPLRRALPSFSAGRLIAGGFRGLWRGFCWCARWVWNLSILFIVLASGLLTLGLLFMLAVLLVWLAQGYPLAGPALFCLGAATCFGALTAFIVTLLVRKDQHAAKSRALPVTKEVQHA